MVSVVDTREDINDDTVALGASGVVVSVVDTREDIIDDTVALGAAVQRATACLNEQSIAGAMSAECA